jgi:actin-like protein 6A
MEAAVLQSCGAEIKPRYSFKRKEGEGGVMEVTPLDVPKTTESYRRFMQEAVAADIKESVCRVYDGAFDEEQTKNMPTVAYELPDGQEIQVCHCTAPSNLLLPMFPPT